MKSIAMAVLGAVWFLTSGCNRQAPVQAKQDSGPVKIRTPAVLQKELHRDVESVGSLFPYEEVMISSEIEGRVVEVGADLGDNVTQGQTLVQVSEESSVTCSPRTKPNCGRRSKGWDSRTKRTRRGHQNRART